jgi:chromate transport protein ChrA
MPPNRQSPKRLRWWDQPADDRTLFKILRLLLDKDKLTLMVGLFVLIFSTPWLLLTVASVAAAGILCAFLIRSANRKDSLSVLKLGHL